LAALKLAVMIANSPFATHDAGSLVHESFADALRRRLIDQEIARVLSPNPRPT
jgi:hypothetical protein